MGTRLNGSPSLPGRPLAGTIDGVTPKWNQRSPPRGLAGPGGGQPAIRI
jgi:hypothetical protein